MEIRNHTLALKLDKAGAITVQRPDRPSTWGPCPWTGTPGELLLKGRGACPETRLDLAHAGKIRIREIRRSEGTGFSIRYQGLKLHDGKNIGGQVHVEVLLAEHEPLLHVHIVDVSIPTSTRRQWSALHYPARTFCQKTWQAEGFALLPVWQGLCIPAWPFTTIAGEFMRRDDKMNASNCRYQANIYGWNALRMPWFSQTRNAGDGVFAHIETPHDAAVEVIANGARYFAYPGRAQDAPYERILSIHPVWRPAMGRLGYTRKITYRFVNHAGPSDMAREYRKIAVRDGIHKSLKEKAGENPNVKLLEGATHLNLYGGYPHHQQYKGYWWTFHDVEKVLRDLKNTGIERALFVAWGLFKTLPPDCWPPDEDKGGIAGLAKLNQTAKELGYLFTGYHAYSPNLPHASSFDPDRSVRAGDFAISFGGRWGSSTSAGFLRKARRDLSQEIATTHPNANFTDIIGVIDLLEDHHPEHTLNRTQDLQNRIDTFKYIRSLGLVNGTEGGQAWCVPYCDYLDGLTYHGSCNMELIFGFPIPLFNMVFHDAAVTAQHPLDDYSQNSSTGDYAEKALRDLLYGCAPLHSFSLEHYRPLKPMIKETYDLIAKYHGATFYETLEDHRYLRSDFRVEQTVFSNGFRITINHFHGDLEGEGVGLMPGLSYRIERHGKLVETGQFQAALHRARIRQHPR